MRSPGVGVTSFTPRRSRDWAIGPPAKRRQLRRKGNIWGGGEQKDEAGKTNGNLVEEIPAPIKEPQSRPQTSNPAVPVSAAILPVT